MDDSHDPFQKLNDLLQDALAQDRRRKENTYVATLIEVLRPYGDSGLLRGRVIEKTEHLRRQRGLRIPLKFEQTVQSTFNQHSVDSSLTINSGTAALFFSSRHHRRDVYWVVESRRADAWLRARAKARNRWWAGDVSPP